jgi:hypothetical protein
MGAGSTIWGRLTAALPKKARDWIKSIGGLKAIYDIFIKAELLYNSSNDDKHEWATEQIIVLSKKYTGLTMDYGTASMLAQFLYEQWKKKFKK